MRALLIVSLLGTAATVASADPPTKVGPPIAVLGDHLRATLPVGMKLEARGHDIMSADESNEDETRAVLDAGGVRFVMMAYELYATTGTDFKAAAAANAVNEAPGATLDSIATAKPLTAFAGVPTPTTGPDPNLIYVAWIANADASVQLLAFYINTSGARTAEAWTAVAKKIVATLTVGKRTLTTQAGPRPLGNYVVLVPDGWVTSTQLGPDFVVYHLRKMMPIGDAGPSCGVYQGGYAGYQFGQQHIDQAKISKVPGKLLGTAVDWYVWDNGGNFVTEAMVKANGTIHVFCSATTAAELVDLRKLGETLHAK